MRVNCVSGWTRTDICKGISADYSQRIHFNADSGENGVWAGTDRQSTIGFTEILVHLKPGYMRRWAVVSGALSASLTHDLTRYVHFLELRGEDGATNSRDKGVGGQRPTKLTGSLDVLNGQVENMNKANKEGSARRVGKNPLPKKGTQVQLYPQPQRN
ncbi:hypothetical protein M405DRAFT_847951 [Rhizopogon salebrosus TDB-379]|nr:hypothetical protein M405DRAFT_847951 [Rhizopogon salebrosus TDB-379]